MEEASRFGILHADSTGKIDDFEEKPQEPKSNKASMGVYVFTWDVLREFLERDNENQASSHDFGKDIIPSMLRENRPLFAWSFDGYWKDVGTTESLWQANMDLLDKNCLLHLNDDELRVYTRNFDCPPTYISNQAKIHQAMITRGCQISGTVTSSIISSECEIEEGASVLHSVLLPGVTVKSGATVQYAIVGENAVISSGKMIGTTPEDDEPTITVVPENRQTAQEKESVTK